MLTTYKMTPQYYNRESRDFQILGRIFDIIFNYIKTNVDVIQQLPLSKNSPYKLLKLAATTVGFQTNHEYDNHALRLIVLNFINLVKKKGTLTAIEELLNILINSQNVNNKININVVKNEYIDTVDETTGATVRMTVPERKLDIFIPSNLHIENILEDTLSYILPTGFIFNITEASGIEELNTKTDLNVSINKSTKSTKQVSSIRNYTFDNNSNIPSINTVYAYEYDNERNN